MNAPGIGQNEDTKSQHQAVEEQERPSDSNKRRLFKSAGALGVAGAVGGLMTGLGVSNAQAQSSTNSNQGSTQFAKPAKLKAGAQLDSRFPVSFNESVSHGLRLIIEYFTALNQRDHRAIARTLHFPFAIYEDIDPIVFNSEAEFIANPPPTLNGTGKGYSKIAKGSYDLLESVDVHLYCPVGGVFSLSFARYTEDGNKLLDCDGLFSVTNNDGRWAIQLVSTLVHERGYENNQYLDAEMTHRVGSQGYLAAFGYRDEELLNDRSKGRGSYEVELPNGTKRAAVSFSYGPRDRSRNARENRPMDGWVTEGIKTRLSVSEITAETSTGTMTTNLDQFVALAGGTVGEYDYTRMRPDRPLIIHATHDKAHVLGGYWRYTAGSELISETRSVSIRIYKGGRWGDVGNLGQVTHHDLSNSV